MKSYVILWNVLSNVWYEYETIYGGCGWEMEAEYHWAWEGIDVIESCIKYMWRSGYVLNEWLCKNEMFKWCFKWVGCVNVEWYEMFKWSFKGVGWAFKEFGRITIEGKAVDVFGWLLKCLWRNKCVI